MSSKVFRKVALERLSSPEQLDQLMQVTNPQGWLALAALGALLLAALAWGMLGSIPTVAAGEGILLRQGGVADLVATGTGQVAELDVQLGDQVAKGQQVGRLRQEALERQIQDQHAKLADQNQELAALQRFATEQARLSQRGRAQERQNLERSIATLDTEIKLLRERRTAEEDLLGDGLITKQTLLATEQELNAALDRKASQVLELNGLELHQLETRQQLDQQIETRQNVLRDLELELKELQARLAEESAIVSPHNGRVLELMVDRGDVVAPGTPILSLEVTAEELVTVLFVPAAEGKKVRPGMEARITPSTVKREEHGFMYGRVTWVAEFPSTSRGMLRLLANQELVTRLMEKGPPIQVDVTLDRSAETPTGFRWSSSRGPEVEITSGTLAGGSVIVREDRPISLVLPWLRDKLGV